MRNIMIALLLFVYATFLGCAGLSLRITPNGAVLAYETPEFSQQMKGVSAWAGWLADAPSGEVQKHLPGVRSWLDKLGGAAK